MSKVRVAIMGCGGMAGAHAHRYKSNPDVEIVALCDVSEEQVSKFIERNLKDYEPAPAVFTDPAKCMPKPNRTQFPLSRRTPCTLSMACRRSKPVATF